MKCNAGNVVARYLSHEVVNRNEFSLYVNIDNDAYPHTRQHEGNNSLIIPNNISGLERVLLLLQKFMPLK